MNGKRSAGNAAPKAEDGELWPVLFVCRYQLTLE